MGFGVARLNQDQLLLQLFFNETTYFLHVDTPLSVSSNLLEKTCYYK